MRLTATKGASILRVRRDEEYLQEMMKWMRLFNERYGSGSHPEVNFFADEPGHREFVERTLELAKDPGVVEVLASVPAEDVRRPERWSEPLFRDNVKKKYLLHEKDAKSASSSNYVRLELNSFDKKALVEAIEKENVPSTHLQVFHHVTIMHHSDRAENETEWARVCALRGQTLAIIPHSYVNVKGTIVVGVHLRDSEGKSADHLVHSGIPHVTGFVPKGFKHKDAGPLFRAAHAEGAIPISGLSFNATVMT